MENDGLVKNPIFVVVDLKRRLAVPHVLSNRRFRYYDLNIELFEVFAYLQSLSRQLR